MTAEAKPKWDRRVARQGRLDGRFLVGEMGTGVYHLPSCPLVSGRGRDVVAIASEAMAKHSGLRPCKRCHPDRLHAERGDGSALFRTMTAWIAAEPAAVSSADALAARAGLDALQLDVLIADHAQLPTAEWLARERVRFVAACLRNTGSTLTDIATMAGFMRTADLERLFVERMRLTPADYRALAHGDTFRVRLPADYRPEAVLAYQGRDPHGLAERIEKRRIWKALSTFDGPAVLELHLRRNHADVRVHATGSLGFESMAELHGDTLKMLGLVNDIAPFEAAHPALVRRRPGLRVPLIPSAFDALCWAIVGQQINLAFAGSLRRELIMLAGRKIGDMMVHPTPEAVAALDQADLTSRRFSRSKARYLVEAAQAIVDGTLPIESLADGSAVDAERALTARHGIGTWTARYVQMRTGFADAAPVGDSGLATALQRMYAMPERPDATAAARLMMPFSPWRSLASMHLWASLDDPA